MENLENRDKARLWWKKHTALVDKTLTPADKVTIGSDAGKCKAMFLKTIKCTIKVIVSELVDRQNV